MSHPLLSLNTLVLLAKLLKKATYSHMVLVVVVFPLFTSASIAAEQHGSPSSKDRHNDEARLAEALIEIEFSSPRIEALVGLLPNELNFLSSDFSGPSVIIRLSHYSDRALIQEEVCHFELLGLAPCAELVGSLSLSQLNELLGHIVPYVTQLLEPQAHEDILLQERHYLATVYTAASLSIHAAFAASGPALKAAKGAIRNALRNTCAVGGLESGLFEKAANALKAENAARDTVEAFASTPWMVDANSFLAFAESTAALSDTGAAATTAAQVLRNTNAKALKMAAGKAAWRAAWRAAKESGARLARAEGPAEATVIGQLAYVAAEQGVLAYLVQHAFAEWQLTYQAAWNNLEKANGQSPGSLSFAEWTSDSNDFSTPYRPTLDALKDKLKERG